MNIVETWLVKDEGLAPEEARRVVDMTRQDILEDLLCQDLELAERRVKVLCASEEACLEDIAW